MAVTLNVVMKPDTLQHFKSFSISYNEGKGRGGKGTSCNESFVSKTHNCEKFSLHI
jgi:hypothetical protein